ncbi:THO complex subunit 2-like [Centruroides sculpturatus]|uniref:THO complex subunit 2-like n=1 Tax=Centruroides sculpturatus TaxID=218467 RepID=UPI000C6E48A2|nr:THO complex subunit 2-like [Centruroides sculpturatus]
MAVARYVSPEIYKNWEKGNKNDFLKLCRSFLQGTQQNSPIFRSQAKDLKHILYEVCSNVVQGSLRLEPTLLVLAEVVQLHSDLSSIISDILLLLDTETQCLDNRECRERFFWLLNGCNKKIVPEYIIKERLEFETTGDAGILKQRNTTQTKFIKIKTRLFYKQQKFNLFREESEGYAKLITELNQEIGGSINSSYMLEVTRSLIGCFNLDPNRVLDIILESFECRLDLAHFYIPLLQSFLCNSATLSQVLGFKLSFYQLVPEDNKILEKHKQELQNARTYARRASALIVSSEKANENQEDSKDEDNQWQEDNQKLGLCEALLEVGDWEHAHQLISCLPEFYAVSHAEIAKSLCSLIHVIIEPLYRKHCGLPSGLKSTPLPTIYGITPVKQVKSFSNLKKTVFPMVLCLGPQLHLSPILMVKIIRLAKYWMNEVFFLIH